ncbi:MAG: serine racemase VanT catalytic subunit, partial [Clostridiaceae bacterium]|nr:serine racemase VanT catalytic subunit [Clostridiaceae bacterium]
KKMEIKQAFFSGLLLYVIGLFGDSYYGISENIRLLKAVYQGMFVFFDYTRNGLFFAPVFFLMGALIAQYKKSISVKICITGFVFSIVFMIIEGLLLKSFNLQKHDSMYFMLLPCMFFLFQVLLLWRGKRHKYLRDTSLFIYILHPAVIVVVRGFAKVTGLKQLLVDNSIVHFVSVALISSVSSVFTAMLMNMESKQRSICTHDMDRAWAEIDMTNLRHNIKVLRGVLPAECKIMAVVKANAYGHGAVPVSVCLNRSGIDAFAVATIDEGIHLRKAGVRGEILILGYTSPLRAYELFRYNLSQTIADVEHAKELNSFGKPIQIHIKINTGMNRLGESYKHVSEIASVFNCKNLKVNGIFTHLSVPDSLKELNVAFTKQQIHNFYELLNKLRDKGITIPPVHIQSSYGVLNYPGLQCDYVRTGIGLYGVLSAPGQSTRISMNLKPVLALKSKVALIRTVTAGESVGYSRNYTVQKETRIAVVPIGYADGIPRSLSANGYVLIKGYRAPIVGQICMDQLMVNISDIPDVKRGDVVTLIGKDGFEEITAEQVAFNAETITNELLSRLSDFRLKRVYF